MKEQLLFVLILLTIIVLSNANLGTYDRNFISNSVTVSLMHRHAFNTDHPLEQKHRVIFTEAHRKFQNDSLQIHNVLRTRHCVPSLILDEEINIRAQIYAEYLAKKDGKLIHSADRGSHFGENLYSITRKTPIKSLSAEKVVHAWYAEIALYDYNHPHYTKETGHFTQIIWKETKRLGTGYAWAREGRKMYVVAQYGPPGNYNFEFTTNVFKPEC